MSESPPMSDDARATLEAYRAASPGAARRQANLEGVRARVRSEAPTKAAAAGLMWPLGWGLASATAAAGLLWGLVSLREPPPAPESQPPAVDAPATEPLPPESPRAQPMPSAPDPVLSAEPPVQRPSPKRIKPRRDETAPSPGASSSLREETRLLREVRASLSAGELQQASVLLDRYTQDFPNGALREDAQAYRIVVRCGQTQDATALRNAFVRRYPASPHAARIEAACDEGADR